MLVPYYILLYYTIIFYISFRKALKLGTSVHWSEVLFMLTGSREVSADALLLYYKPLIVWIEKQVIDHKIPVGW